MESVLIIVHLAELFNQPPDVHAAVLTEIAQWDGLIIQIDTPETSMPRVGEVQLSLSASLEYTSIEGAARKICVWLHRETPPEVRLTGAFSHPRSGAVYLMAQLVANGLGRSTAISQYCPPAPGSQLADLPAHDLTVQPESSQGQNQ